MRGSIAATTWLAAGTDFVGREGICLPGKLTASSTDLAISLTRSAIRAHAARSGPDHLIASANRTVCDCPGFRGRSLARHRNRRSICFTVGLRLGIAVGLTVRVAVRATGEVRVTGGMIS